MGLHAALHGGKGAGMSNQRADLRHRLAQATTPPNSTTKRRGAMEALAGYNPHYSTSPRKEQRP